MFPRRKLEQLRREIHKNASFSDKAVLFKCIGDPTCLKILYLLTQEKEVCVSDLTQILGISMPAVSHQLAKLKSLGILSTKRMGQMICYSYAGTKRATFIKRLIRER